MHPAPTLAVLIMAAGRSLRMGQDKLLLCDQNGQTLLEDRIIAATHNGYRVFVALPPDTPDRLRIVQNGHATPLICPNAAQGLGHSLSQAVAQLPPGLDSVLIMLADMPALSANDLEQVCAAFDPGRIVRGATPDRVPGHPVLIPAQYLDRLTRLIGDSGAQNALKDLPLKLVPLPEKNAIWDVDTPDDWQAWSKDH
ncbi:nucleotidyltransferase family protein [Aliiroseovarius sp. M344]|uniref:nucleotidyltransferase family protein n=1 Tax=Aliiroseovarius sp. M344 TaxID=2867010 RepID=UPI0021AD810D|nr:nucleotidyltransferase family protein [Aliiroseovarius sp. M344]UWQ13016.1 nucleotidyltransferase family protein [Aliiroseovarius sp. M344]